MSKKIETYEDLLEEKARLEELVKAQKALVRDDFELVKDSIRPIGATISNAYGLIRQLTPVTPKRTGSPLFNLGLDFGIEVLLKRFVLGNAGWLARVVVPYVVKNYSYKFLNNAGSVDKATSLWKRVKHLVSKDKKDY